jgi:hypothetical protein
MYAQVGTSHAGSCALTIGKVTIVAAKVNNITKVIADIFDLFFIFFIFFFSFLFLLFFMVRVQVALSS